jgi:hypothetical protein
MVATKKSYIIAAHSSYVRSGCKVEGLPEQESQPPHPTNKNQQGGKYRKIRALAGMAV